MIKIKKVHLYISIFLFFIATLVINIPKTEAGTAITTFTTANEFPANVTNISIQDGFTNAEQCSGGESWDYYDDDNNMTTHMLNATIRWNEGTDLNGDNIKTFFCISYAYENIQTLTQKNESTNATCNVVNAWAEDWAIDDNSSGLILSVNYSVPLTYNGTHNDFYGAAMAWDTTPYAQNRSSIVYFNFTILNTFPTSATNFAPATTHDTTPDISWTASTDAEDGTGADKCPKDTVTYTLNIGDNTTSYGDRLSTSDTNNFYLWATTALEYNNTITSGQTIRYYYFRINATDGHTNADYSSYTGTFSLTNDIPTVVSNFRLNQTEGLLHSHSPGPRMDWDPAEDTDAGDTVTYNVSASTTAAEGPYELLYNNITTLTQNENFFYKIIPWGNILNEGNWTNKTVYVRIYAYDDKQSTLNEGAFDITIQLTNRIPTAPYNFNTTATHDQQPNIGWGASVDEEGDPITYYLTIGEENYGDNDYEDSSQSNNYETVDAPINWGSEGQGTDWNNNTVYVSIYAVDDKNTNISVSYLNTTMQLTDYVPNVIEFLLSDTVTPYGNCTVGTCTINPISGTNISLAARLTVEDLENDCSDTTLPTFHLCLNSTTLTGCEQTINSNFSWILDNYTRQGNNCIYQFNTNLTYVNETPGFYIAPGNYKYNINITSLYGNVRDTDPEKNVSWIYGTLSSVNYTDAISLGGSTVYLGQWSSGTNEYVMTNFGNNILDIRWNTTYLGKAGASFNWTPDGSDYMLDDDNSQSLDDSGLLTGVFLTENDVYFNYSTGLERCVSKDCNSDAYNETLSTYFHIKPPLGLEPGTYSGTLTYTIESHNN